MFDYLAESGVPDVENLLPGLHSSADLYYLKEKLHNWNPNLDIDAKIQDMSFIMKNRPSILEGENTVSDDDYNSIEPAEKIKPRLANSPPLLPLPIIKEEIEEEETTSSPTIPTLPKEIVETTTRSGYWPGPRKLTNCKRFLAFLFYYIFLSFYFF